MPGNEIGDRVHNFFDQDLSQRQHQFQAGDGNRPLLSNNPWVGNQGQVDSPLISSFKNFNAQQSDSERGNVGQSLRVPNGLAFVQSNLRPNSAINEPQYMHGHQFFQSKQNETNFLGVDRELDQHNTVTRGLFDPQTQQGNAAEHLKASMRLEPAESPVKIDFPGGQQLMSNQQLGMMQSLARQQSGFNDVQLLQQQAFLRKMQELQLQQQFQQQEFRLPNSGNHVSNTGKHLAKNHSTPLLNGTSVHDGLNHAWTPELMAGNSIRLQHDTSPILHTTSNGLTLSSEQSHSLHMMGLVPQQINQSLYGFPISNTRGTSSQYSHDHTEKPTLQQATAYGIPFSDNQHGVFPGQVNIQDQISVPRLGFQGRDALGQGSQSGVAMENLQPVDALRRTASVHEFQGRPEEPNASRTASIHATSQNVVPLDPAEEKILFGTDDNIWDVFSKSVNTGTGSYHLLEGTECPLQSGSWSALMQSAVAETSSAELGLQEEWSGLTFPSNEPPTGNHQSSVFNDVRKQKMTWADGNSETAAALKSTCFPLSDNVNKSTNYSSVPGQQQSSSRVSFEQNEGFESNPSYQSMQHSAEESSKGLTHSIMKKPLGEGSHNYGNAGHPSVSEVNAKKMAGSLIHQQSISSYSSGGQLSSGPNGWNYMQTVTRDEDSRLRVSDNEIPLQRGKVNENKMDMHEGMGHATSAWKAISGPKMANQLEHIKADTEIPRLNREDSILSNVATIPKRSFTDGNQGNSQHVPNSHKQNSWKHVGPVNDTRGGEVSDKYQHHQNTGPQVLESSMNSSERRTVHPSEMNNSDKKEDSSGNYYTKLSNPSHNSLRGNVWLDASDSRIPPGAKQKSSGQIGRKSSGPRKFQYHPMGDLDEDAEAYYGTKYVTNSQVLSQQGSQGLKSHDQGSMSTAVGHVPSISIETSKVQVPDSHGHGERSRSDEVSLRGNFSGHVSDVSGPFDRSNGGYASNKSFQSSQNMLELLHKVDQSNQSEISERETSEGSIGHYQRNQSSTSQSFGLQLAPPTQGLVVQNQTSSPQSTSQTVNSLGLNRVISETGSKAHSWLAPTVPQTRIHSLEGLQGESQNNRFSFQGESANATSQYDSQENPSTAFASEYSDLRSQLQSQHTTMPGAQLTANQSIRTSHNRFASRFKYVDGSNESESHHQSLAGSLPGAAGNTPYKNFAFPPNATEPSITSHTNVRIPTQQIQVSVSESSEASGMSKKGSSSTTLPNMWTNISTQQGLLDALAHKDPSGLFSSHLPSNNHLKSTSFTQQKIINQDLQGGNAPSESDGCSVKSQGSSCPEDQMVNKSSWQRVSSERTEQTQATSVLQGKESIVRHPCDASLPDTAVTQRDIEVFGRSLKPDGGLHHNYSLLNQLHAMKKTETDPQNRESKRLKGPDSSLDPQHVALPEPGKRLSHAFNPMGRDASASSTTAVSGDSNVQGFSVKHGENQDKNTSSQNGNLYSQELLAFTQNLSHNHSSNSNTISIRPEHSQISPQMAPSWFNQFGSFKNGMMPVYDPLKNSTLSTGEKPFVIVKPSNSLPTHDRREQVSSDADTHQGDDVEQSSTNISIASDHFASPQVLPPAVSNQILVPQRPKKRKTATSELLPWHKEVTKGGLAWVQNISMAEADWARAAHRVVEKVDDEAEVIEDGILTLRPKRRLILTTQLMQHLLRPPPASVLAANASSSIDCVAYLVGRASVGDACRFWSCDPCIPSDNGNILADMHETSKTTDVQYSKVTENFINRANELEMDLSRLEKKSSILNLRVECQDLEKFSAINRFAKFHGRGQTEGSDPSSSSDKTAISQRIFPQRYVTALPMPRNLPDRVQCLSL